jgi:serine/threonine protein kinase
MPAPSTVDEFLDLVRKSGVVDEKRLNQYADKLRTAGTLPVETNKLAGLLIRDGIVTHFQAEQILQGKWRRFTIGKYKVLERLGSGGMGSVYLCEHKLMRRRVAVKVLPTAKAAEPSSLERFYREARAVASLDHPNIVHAYDIDQDETLHFLVMEYVDGSSLQDIIKKSGPMDAERAAHYVYQAALGLEHAHAAGLVHRDIKPGNLLVDRSGTVKILDMGLARFFNDEEDILTKKYDENVLGTADYLAPEQAVDSHEADTRADIYSLGGTFYYLLTGRTPFEEGTVAQKLIWHQTRQPKPVSTFRSDVPPALLAIIDKMMAKRPEDRYQHPRELSQALASYGERPMAPPTVAEMPRLSPAAGGSTPETVQASVNATQTSSSAGNKSGWQVTPTPAALQRAPAAQPAVPPPSAPPARPATPSPSAPSARSATASPSAPPVRPATVPSTPPARPAAPAPTQPIQAAPSTPLVGPATPAARQAIPSAQAPSAPQVAPATPALRQTSPAPSAAPQRPQVTPAAPSPSAPAVLSTAPALSQMSPAAAPAASRPMPVAAPAPVPSTVTTPPSMVAASAPSVPVAHVATPVTAPRPATAPQATLRAAPLPLPASAPAPQPPLPTGGAPRNNGPTLSNQVWADLMDDTQPGVVGTTLPESPYTARSGKRFKPARPSRQFWIVLGITVAVALVVGTLILAGVFGNWFSRPTPARRALLVGRQGAGENPYPTLAQAMKAAVAGDVIELTDEEMEDNVVLTGQQLKSSAVTLRAAPGKSIIWTSKKGKEAEPLLALSDLKGFILDGDRISFDGKGKMSHLILVSLRCSGLEVRNVTLKGYTDYGIKIMNSTGAEGRPIRLTSLRADLPVSKDGAVVYLDATPGISPDHVDYLDLRDCLVAGLPDHLIKRKSDKVTGSHVDGPPGMFNP